MDSKKSSKLKLTHNPKPIQGEVHLGGSKSITNRALIIQALCKDNFDIQHISDSKDSATLMKLLAQSDTTYDAGHAGTTFRFMTAYLSTQEGTQVLTGSDRMKQRPIAPLVNALNYIGADISYLGQEGYPPIQISNPKTTWKDSVSIDGSMSSQFITALLLIAPVLPNGLTIQIVGNLVSVPYVEMTLKMLQYFGIEHDWSGNQITIRHQDYQAKSFLVEADWSSASYLYNLVAINPGSEIKIKGLFSESLQGDSAIQHFSKKLGVKSTWNENYLLIQYDENHSPIFEYDFIKQPDLAQSVACICAAKGIQGLFTGLQTLFIKETDRVKALSNELGKVGVFLSKMPDKFTKTDEDFYLIEGTLQSPSSSFATYQDHRMAMAFATLATKFDVTIENPEVVVKSFPSYWEVLQQIGFEIEEIQ